MTGHYNQPAETAATFAADGFMRTGGIVVIREDGYIRKLTGCKRPKHIEFRDALPKTKVGTIVRRELRTVAH